MNSSTNLACMKNNVDNFSPFTPLLILLPSGPPPFFPPSSFLVVLPHSILLLPQSATQGSLPLMPPWCVRWLSSEHSKLTTLELMRLTKKSIWRDWYVAWPPLLKLNSYMWCSSSVWELNGLTFVRILLCGIAVMCACYVGCCRSLLCIYFCLFVCLFVVWF